MKHLVVGLALLAAGCPDRSISKLDPRPSGAALKDIPVSADLDVLFVIDNSQSTNDKQTIFASNYPRFVEALEQFPGGRPNLHIGVITTSVDLGVPRFDSVCESLTDQNGRLQNASHDNDFACEPPTADLFLSDIANPDGSRTVNYRGTLASALTCISHAGDKGCGFEAPLEAIKRALDGSHPENAGFLRRGAFLAVIILTDEDDCSAPPTLFELSTDVVGVADFRCAQAAYRCNTEISPTEPGSYTSCRVRNDSLLYPPDDYARFLLSLPEPAGVAVALIAGDPTESVETIAQGVERVTVKQTCNATINNRPAIGRPSIRLEQMLSNFGDHGLFRTVCQSDYSSALTDIGALLFKLISPCLEGRIDTRDTDADDPGLQPDCTVSDLEGADTAAQQETLIPRCAMIGEDQPDLAGERACWWVKANERACQTETGLELHVERSVAAAPNSIVRVACALAEQ